MLSTLNCTPATAKLSLAAAVTAVVPETVAPFEGAVIETVGGVVSVVFICCTWPEIEETRSPFRVWVMPENRLAYVTLICLLYFEPGNGLSQFMYNVAASLFGKATVVNNAPQSAAEMLFIEISSPSEFCNLNVIKPLPVAVFSTLKSRHVMPGGKMHLLGMNLSEEKTPKYAKPATATRTTKIAQPYVTRYSNAACSFLPTLFLCTASLL